MKPIFPRSGTALPLAIAFALTSTSAIADSESKQFMFPATPSFSTPIGIVYPGVGAAAVANPAALTTLDRKWNFCVSNSLPMNGPDYGVSGAVVRSGKNFGMGVGYAGTVGGSTRHGFFAGMATKLGKLSIGASAMQDPERNGIRADAGIMLPMVNHMHFVLKIENAIEEARPNVGLGFRGRVSQFELNFRLPPLSDQAAGSRFESQT